MGQISYHFDDSRTLQMLDARWSTFSDRFHNVSFTMQSHDHYWSLPLKLWTWWFKENLFMKKPLKFVWTQQMLDPLQVFDQLNSTSVIEDGKLADVFVTNYTVVGGNAFVEFRIDSFNSKLNATFLDSEFTDSLPPNRVFGSNNRIVAQGEICYCASATRSELQRHYVLGLSIRPCIRF